MKATGHYFPVLYFIIFYAEKGGSSFQVCGWNPRLWIQLPPITAAFWEATKGNCIHIHKLMKSWNKELIFLI